MEKLMTILLAILISGTVTVAVVTTIKKTSGGVEELPSEVFVPVEPKTVEPEYKEPEYPVIPKSYSPKVEAKVDEINVTLPEVKVVEPIKEVIPPVQTLEVVNPEYIPESVPVVTPPVEPTPPAEPVVLEARFTLILPAGSPVAQPKARMTLKELQFFTANLFKVTDSPYSKLLKASEEELTHFLQSNGYTILREML